MSTGGLKYVRVEALSIRNNLMAFNTARNLSQQYSGLTTAVRRLSSGLRVQSAADDAAGLAISEMGKARAATLMQAKRNIQDGISLAQLADGALETVDASLVRLKELAVQASTGTYNAEQRLIISNEMQQITSEIERAQKALKFNGIDVFKHDSTVEIQSGELVDDNIMVELPKVTATTLGAYMPEGLKSYEKMFLDGRTLGVPVVSESLSDVTQETLSDQTITIRNAADIREVTISEEQGNNTVNGVLAEIENLEMDGVRETSAITYADLYCFSKSCLNGTYGDMDSFEINVGGTTESTYKHSYLIDYNEATTRDNFYATLDRIIKQVNTANDDLDLSRFGSVLVSHSGKSISIGNLEVIDNPAVTIGNFDDTPKTITGADPSTISFDIVDDSETIEVEFEYTGNATVDAENAYDAARDALVSRGLFYDNYKYSSDISHDSPHEHIGSYTLGMTTDNKLLITRINPSSVDDPTPPAELVKIENFRNNQTQVVLKDFDNNEGEAIPLKIEGENVTFIAGVDDAETAQRVRDAINDVISNGGIPDIDGAYLDDSGKSVIITRTGKDDPINISYEDNHVWFDQFSNDEGEDVNFSINGTPISFSMGGDDAATADNLEDALALASLDSNYTISRDGNRIRLSRDGNFNVRITEFVSDATIRALAGDGSSGTQVLSTTNPSAMISVLETGLTAEAGAGSSNIGASNIYRKSGESGTSTEVTTSIATAQVVSYDYGTYLENGDIPFGPVIFSSFELQEGGDRDHLTLDRYNEGPRTAGIRKYNDVDIGWIDSQHTPSTETWVGVSGVGEVVLDPNIMFSVSSDADGTLNSTEAGVFNAKANEPADLLWQSSGPTVKAKIHDFDHQDGETITFSINGITLSYEATSTQGETVNNLLQALYDEQSALTAAGIRFAKTANEEGVYLYQVDAVPLKISGFSAGSGEEDSGFSVWNIDSPMDFEMNSSNTSAEIASWTSLSQMNYKMQEGAQTALNIIDRAIITKDGIRGLLGATQNVLDNHKTFTEITHENTQAMVSQIIDADVALEMTEFVRRQILAQAATAMLAQANSIPRIALQLLQA
jgi:flagellin-like hook-associated protein FlgL